MPLGNLKTQHNLNGKIVSEHELRQATYAMNQQREGKLPKRVPVTPVTYETSASVRTDTTPQTNSGKPVVNTPTADVADLIAANKKDLKQRNLKP